MNLKALVVGLAAGLLLPGASQAAVPVDAIRAFNQALEGDDPSAVIQSAEALIAAAVANPDDPAARSAAFEAGTQLCLRNACERALAAAPLMTGEGDAEISAVLANLLLVYARWSADKTAENTLALENALEATVPESPTLLTIVAFDQYYASRMKGGKLSEIRKIADLAAKHYAPVKNMIPVNWGRVELSAAATAFAESRNDAVIDRLAKLEVSLYPFTLGDRPDKAGIKDIYHQTSAWRLAVSSWFQTREQRERTALRVADTYVETEKKKLAEAYYADKEGPTSYCEITILKPPEISYPASAAKAGYIGAVMVGFEIDDTEIVNVRVLASVPDNQFEDAALAAMKSFRWEFNEVQPDPRCSRSGQQVVYPFQFYFADPRDPRDSRLRVLK
jgi:TonB family protein